MIIECNIMIIMIILELVPARARCMCVMPLSTSLLTCMALNFIRSYMGMIGFRVNLNPMNYPMYACGLAVTG